VTTLVVSDLEFSVLAAADFGCPLFEQQSLCIGEETGCSQPEPDLDQPIARLLVVKNGRAQGKPAGQG